MFRYVNNISDLSHNIIKNHGKKFERAIDATLGNGHDCDFLSGIFSKVYAFDIQQIAIENYEVKNECNVILIHDSHEKLEAYVTEKVDCIMYNLGFMPKGDKNITTKSESTISSIKSALNLIDSGGIITIGIYPGHEAGKKEGEVVLDFVTHLPKAIYGVMLHTFINRENNPPQLLVIEKK